MDSLNHLDSAGEERLKWVDVKNIINAGDETWLAAKPPLTKGWTELRPDFD